MSIRGQQNIDPFPPGRSTLVTAFAHAGAPFRVHLLAIPADDPAVAAQRRFRAALRADRVVAARSRHRRRPNGNPGSDPPSDCPPTAASRGRCLPPPMNRMFEEMSAAGLPEPRLQQTDAGFRVTLFTSDEAEQELARTFGDAVPPAFAPALERLFLEGSITTGQVVELAGVSPPTARRHLRVLADAGWIEHRSRSARDPSSHWRLIRPVRRRWRPSQR